MSLELEAFWPSTPGGSQALGFAHCPLRFQPSRALRVSPYSPISSSASPTSWLLSFSLHLVYVLAKPLSHFSALLGGREMKGDLPVCAEHFRGYKTHAHPSSPLPVCAEHFTGYRTHPHPSSHSISPRSPLGWAGREVFSATCNRTPNMIP